jgi:hypothetical protein
MQIDRTNYEIYFLDYLDGNLSVDLIDQFLDFLERNPDLKEELQSVFQAPVTLPGETIVFEGKKSLLKNELTGSSGFDYQAIAWMEGDLNEEEEILFKKELQNDPQKQKAFNFIKTLRLQPQQNISFPDKNKLLKKDRKRSLWIWAGPVAALLMLGFLIRILSPDSPNETLPQQKAAVVTQNKPSAEKQTVAPQTEEKQQPPVTVSKKTTIQPAISEPAKMVPSKQISPKEPKKTSILGTEEEPLAALQPIQAGSLPVRTEKIRKLPLQKQGASSGVEYTKLTDYLAQKLLDVPKGEPVTLAGIARAGLQVAEDISHNKLNIEKGKEGHIEEIRFNSMLFGFSIPVKKNK